MGSAFLPHCSQVWLPAHVPGDCITIHLQELQQLLGLLSISCLLLGSESVVGDQQRVGPTTWGGKDQKSGGWEGPRPLSLKWFLQLKAYIITRGLTYEILAWVESLCLARD